MKVLVVPVSGQYFVNQLGVLVNLSKLNWRPDLILATSGGNVASYIIEAAEWDENKIEMVFENMKCDMYVSSWFPNFYISLFIGLYKGTIYDSGVGCDDFFYKYFGCGIEREIWTGVFNKTDNKAQLFCNKSEKKSIIAIDDEDLELNRMDEPVYMNEDYKFMSKVCMASATIPGLVPDQIINNKHYIDGGIAAPSPLSEVLEQLKILGRDGLSIVYVPAHDIETDVPGIPFTSINTLANFSDAHFMIQMYNCIQDRKIAHNLVSKLSSAEGVKQYNKIFEHADIKRLNCVFSKKFSMVEMYPQEIKKIKFEDFTTKDLKETLKISKESTWFRVWKFDQ